MNRFREYHEPEPWGHVNGVNLGIESGDYQFLQVHPDKVGTFGGLNCMIAHYLRTDNQEEVLVRFMPVGRAFK